MQPDTGAPFPLTRWSIVQGASSEDDAVRVPAIAEIARLYWAPVYTCLRLQHRLDIEDARDATQEFFLQALTRALFGRYDPSRARFRTWIRLCLDSFIANDAKARRRLKRGADAQHIPLDEAEALVGRYASSDIAMDAIFDREWLRALIERALEDFRAKCQATGRETHFALMHRYDIELAESRDRPDYRMLAQQFDLPVTQVNNHLHWARRHFRECLLETLRAHSGSEEEFREDARVYFGVSAV